MKRRNPRFGCPHIAQQIAYTFQQWQANLRILDVEEIKTALRMFHFRIPSWNG